MALTSQQSSVARAIINEGRRMRAPRHVIRVAVGAAKTEANLENPSGGDADSVGSFQQRPSWGSLAQRTKVAYAARKFYEKAIPLYEQGYRGGRLAQAVQVSAFPGRYQPNVQQAGGIVKALGGDAVAVDAAKAPQQDKAAPTYVPAPQQPGQLQTPLATKAKLASAPLARSALTGGRTPGDISTPVMGHMEQPAPTTPQQPDVAAMPGASIFQKFNQAAKQLEAMHKPYVWGGGHGTTPEIGSGVDCSGAMRWLLRQSGWKGALPSVASDFQHFGKPGPGAITFYSSATHVFAKIGNRFFGTSQTNPGHGAGFIQGGEDVGGYTVTHLPGIGPNIVRSLKQQKVVITNGEHTTRPKFSDKPILSDRRRKRGR